MSGRLKHAQRSHRNHTKAQKQKVDEFIKNAYRANLAKTAKLIRKEKKG